ncbi:MAG: glycosyltransferase family A protein [Chloroflexota bacterium]
MSPIIPLVITFAFVILWLTAVSNFLLFPRLNAKDEPLTTPLVSILIPARNEARTIGRAVASLLAQTYANFEVLVLDDQSGDETAVLATQAAKNDPRFRLIRGEPLPPGWLGKNWACHQLAQAARGEVLLFADADVVWELGALTAVVAHFSQHQADLLAVWPTQQTKTWGERLVVPLINFAILCYLPILPVHHTHIPAFAAANGQCLAFRRTAYEAIGGHAALRGNVIEDMAFAQRIKRHRLRLRLADSNRLIGCRMYENWDQVRAGFAKNILAGHSNSILFLLVSTLFHWLLFVCPWVWLLLGGGWWALGLVLAGVGLRLATAVFTHTEKWLPSLLMPLSVFLMTRIAAQAIWWHWHGGGQWKGRTITAT